MQGFSGWMIGNVKNPISLTFGELDAVLAGMHRIDQTKRTAFQSRLKNFHRLGYPIWFQATKGRAATYSPCQIVEMALAVEMTQLGLPPERITAVLGANLWATLKAFQIAARFLADSPTGFGECRPDATEPLSMFLYFDPAALHPLTLHLPASVVPDQDEASNSFFYGGIGIVREGIASWTSSGSPRLSIVNVTAMIDAVAQSPFEQGTEADTAYRLAFFRQLEAEAIQKQSDWEGSEEAEEEQACRLLERESVSEAGALAERMGISMAKAAIYLQDHASTKEGRP